jgi:HAD superfamily phosphoserine phosphatase-like hydrolase
VLVDYDGTIALTDVSDTIMAENVGASAEVWEAWTAEWEAGLTGSRQMMERELSLLTVEPRVLVDIAERQPHDASFAPFVRSALAAGVPVEVVSDGYGFFIGPALERLGVPPIPIVTARTIFGEGPPTIEFPNGHPDCFVCGTCKRNRVLAHRAAGRRVVFVGDGESDRYAAAHADMVFAKRALVGICIRNGWPFRRWTEFAEVEAWVRSSLEAWREDASSLPSPPAKAPYCGPEVWGPGRDAPGKWIHEVESSRGT